MVKRAPIDKGRGRNAERTRQAILQAAREVFSRQDYGSVALSDVAERAGVTQSLIHHYFKSKSRLFLYAVHTALDEHDEGLDAFVSPGLTTPEFLPAALRGYHRFLAENEVCLRLIRVIDQSLASDPGLLKSLAELDDEGGTGNPQRMKNLRAAYERVLELQAAGRLRPGIDPKALLMVMLSVVEHWFSSSKRLNHRLAEALGRDVTQAGVDAESYLGTALELFLHGAMKDPEPDAS